MSMTTPGGVYAASLTPLDPATLRPDIDRLVAHSRWLLDRGCDGLGILGTTGEANSLSVADRRRVIEAAAAALPPERLMPGIGSCALADAVELGTAALKAGVRTLLCLPPFYYKPVPEAAVEAFFDRLIDGLADPDLRLYLYHFPQLTGFAFTVPMVERMIARHGAIIAGMKDSSGVLENMTTFARSIPGFGVFAGSEQFLLPVLEAGAVGCISATTNLTSPLAQLVFRQRRAADQERLTAQRLAIQKYPLVAMLKGLMQRHSGDAAWAGMLPPALPVAEADIAALAAQLQALGVEGLKLAA
ncbi:MAG: dihydrodipicolinate synthase family protein [Alphaproteobacteria bacterium]|jgi:4-hydroxy-tetrahydrodipicolinate synthase|nr:dihydrodipicolinate synthase family protein [Alphaproteobacteria bacterium]